MAGAVRRGGAVGSPGRAPRVAAARRERPRRVRHPRVVGGPDLRTRRGAPQGTAVVVRPGPARGARLGLRLCQNRRPALGHAGNRSLRRADARGSVPRRAGRDSRWAGHRGVRGGERRPAAARHRTRERDADRTGRSRQLGRAPARGARGGAAQLLPALRLARRSRLPGGAAAAHTGGSSGVDVAGRGDRRTHPLLGQPPEAPARATRPAAAHATRRPGSGPPDRRRRQGARCGAGDRRRQRRVPAQGPVALPYRRRRRVPCS